MFKKWESRAPHAFILEPSFGMDCVCGQYTGAQREDLQHLGLSTSKSESNTSCMPWMKRSETNLPSTRVRGVGVGRWVCARACFVF